MDKAIEDISKGINPITTFTDQDNYTPNPNDCIKLVSIINNDINTLKTVLSKYMQASLDLNRYIDINNIAIKKLKENL